MAEGERSRDADGRLDGDGRINATGSESELETAHDVPGQKYIPVAAGPGCVVIRAFLLLSTMGRLGFTLFAALAAILGGYYQFVLGPKLTLLGYGRVFESIGNRNCRAIPELQACESAFEILCKLTP